ncbi:DUF6059 family protein [Streptomyces odonnellii]|uniref:DUF6059 family protein n=1 Tax=Streptomyces odonnellii TaxID=1417980 RepID=UPI00062525B8|nr:DUF6059 family protein [Streptomyces odonnellii]
MCLRLARLLRSLVSSMGKWMIAYGQIWVYIPPSAPQPRPGSRPLTGPVRGHPERLCPEVPLNEVELALRRELLGSSGAEP